MQLNAIRFTALALALSGASLAFSSTASACTTGAWSSVTGAPTAAEPSAVKRYSGACGMQPELAGSSFVTDNSPNGTTDGTSNPYRARFYVYTGVNGNSPVVFSATDSDGGAGATAVSISRTTSGFSFTIPGTTVANFVESGGATVFNNKWYGIEIFYQNGQSFTATVRGANAPTATVLTSAGNVSGGPAVGSASLGVINAAASTTAMSFDDFESTRSAASAIGFRCRGDANDSGGAINVFDTVAIVAERVNGTLAPGMPDCNEDGSINVFDTACVIGLRLANATCD